MELLFRESARANNKARNLTSGICYSDIKSLMPGEELNDKVCTLQDKAVPVEVFLDLSDIENRCLSDVILTLTRENVVFSCPKSQISI